MGKKQTEVDWVDIDQIAGHLKLSKITLYRMLAARKIPAYKVGKQWRFNVSEVDRWVTQKKERQARAN